MMAKTSWRDYLHEDESARKNRGEMIAAIRRAFRNLLRMKPTPFGSI